MAIAVPVWGAKGAPTRKGRPRAGAGARRRAPAPPPRASVEAPRRVAAIRSKKLTPEQRAVRAAKRFKVGDRVRHDYLGQVGDMLGTVVSVTPTKFGSGGTRAYVRVRWDSGSTGRHEDRQLGKVKE